MQCINTYFSVRLKKACQSGFLFHSTFILFFLSILYSFQLSYLWFALLPLLLLPACLRMSCQGAAIGSCIRGCSAAAVTLSMVLPHDLLQPGLWCAACTVCQHVCSVCSRLQINDWLWPGRISSSSSSSSYVKVGRLVSGSTRLGSWSKNHMVVIQLIREAEKTYFLLLYEVYCDH